jgi:hypothetical protein
MVLSATRVPRSGTSTSKPPELLGIALFGTAGAGDADAWPSGSEAPLSPELISQAHRRLRYRVLPTP